LTSRTKADGSEKAEMLMLPSRNQRLWTKISKTVKPSKLASPWKGRGKGRKLGQRI